MLDYRHVIRRPRDMSEVEVRIELDEDGLPRLVCCWVAWSLVGGQVALWRVDADSAVAERRPLAGMERALATSAANKAVREGRRAWRAIEDAALKAMHERSSSENEVFAELAYERRVELGDDPRRAVHRGEV